MILFWIFIFIFLIFALACIAWPLLSSRLLPLSRLRERVPVGRVRADHFDYIILVSASVFIIIFSLSLYLIQGNSLALKQSIILQKQAARRQELLEEINNNPQKAINIMKIYIKKHPQDKRAQYLLKKLEGLDSK